MELKVYDKISDKLRSDWKNLWAGSAYGNFFNSYEWFDVNREVYGISSFKIVTLYEKNKLMLLLPLYRKKIFGVNVWEDFGDIFADSSSLLLIYADPFVLNRLFGFFEKLKTVYIKEIPQSICKLLDEKKYVVVEKSVTPYLPILKEPLRYLTGTKKKKILKILVNMKLLKIKKNKSLNLDEIKNIEIRSAKKLAGKNIMDNELTLKFLRVLLKKYPNNVRIYFLTSEDNKIAYKIDFECKDTIYSIQKGYLSRYSQYAPGKILEYSILESFSKEGMQLYRMGRGSDSFKRDFSPFYFFQSSILITNNIIIKYWVTFIARIKNIIVEHKNVYRLYKLLKNILTKN